MYDPKPAEPTGPLLEVDDLRVVFPTDDGPLTAVDGVSFSMSGGEVLGVVGESGSGKTVTALAILGLLPARAKVTGSVKWRGRELVGLPERELRAIRGEEIAIIFQDALAALNPVWTVGRQIAEQIAVHHDAERKELRFRVTELLDLVGIPNPGQRYDQYPHEYSGGMRQRAMIAMALANDPALLIADEPTTALDVTLQAQVLEVLERVQERTSSSIMLITHDLGVVAGIVDRVTVMYAGRHVESASVDDAFYSPRHPYTLGLLASLPRLDRESRRKQLYRIKGQPPSLVSPPSGCPFHPRCDFATLPDPCATVVPQNDEVEPDHRAACHNWRELVGLTPEFVREQSA